MLKIDGAAVDLDGREFTYELPAPFGPKKGEAFLTVVARPATAGNEEYKAVIENIVQKAKVNDVVREKVYEERKNADRYVQSQDRDIKALLENLANAQYDYCVVSWETNIQSDGKDLATTKESFIALKNYPHPALVEVFEQLDKDLADFDNFVAVAQAKAQAEDEKN